MAATTTTTTESNPTAVRKFTVEPVLGCYVVAMMLSAFATQNLNLEKACRVNLRMDADTCAAQSNGSAADFDDAEKSAQALVSDVILWKTIAQSAVLCALVVFVGSWSDRHRKRKPCILAPVLGEFVATAGRLLCVYYYFEFPMEATAVVEAVPVALTGGVVSLTISVFNYVGDVTTVETRSFEIGLVNAFMALGAPIAIALTGILLPTIGIGGVFIVSLVLLAISFVYGLIFIKESNAKYKYNSANDVIGKRKNKQSLLEWLKDFFDMQHIRDAFRVTFRKGPYHKRTRIVLLMLMVFIVMGPTQGETQVMYLYTRLQFKWKEVEFARFLTYLLITNVIGTTIAASLLIKRLNIDDALIGAMACVSKILSGFIYTFATSETIFYLGPLAEIISGIATVALRSIITKLVSPNELGQLNAVFGICETLVPVIYGPMYISVYKATMKTMPGLCFLIGTILLSPAIVIFLWIYTEHKKQKNTTSATEIANEKIKKCTIINGDKYGSYSKLPSNNHNEIVYEQ